MAKVTAKNLKSLEGAGIVQAGGVLFTVKPIENYVLFAVDDEVIAITPDKITQLAAMLLAARDLVKNA